MENLSGHFGNLEIIINPGFFQLVQTLINFADLPLLPLGYCLLALYRVVQLLGLHPVHLARRAAGFDLVPEHGRADSLLGHYGTFQNFVEHQVVVHRLRDNLNKRVSLKFIHYSSLLYLCDLQIFEFYKGEPAGFSRLLRSAKSEIGDGSELLEKLSHLSLVETVGNMAEN